MRTCKCGNVITNIPEWLADDITWECTKCCGYSTPYWLVPLSTLIRGAASGNSDWGRRRKRRRLKND